MKYFLPLILAIFSFSQIIAQDADALKKEIDAQIWYPFMKAWNNFDAAAFNAIHADNMLRGGPRDLKSGEEYKGRNHLNFKTAKKRGDIREISFTFEYRVHEEDKAYEVGYYKIKSLRDGNTNYYYGQFHVVLNKIDGQWKIVQDWDADKINGVEVGEEHFMKFADAGIYELE